MTFLKMLGNALESLLHRGEAKPGKDETAVGAVRSAVDQGPSAAEIASLADLYNAGRFEELESRARAITAQYPNHGTAWKVLGIALLQQGREAEALPAMVKAANLMPGDFEAQKNLGVVFQRQSQFADAQARFEQALGIKPESAEVQLNLGDVLIQQGRVIEAESNCRRAVELAPGFAEAHHSLGVALASQGRLADAAASFGRALESRPGFAEALINLGGVLAGQGRFVEAEASFRKGLDIDSSRAAVHNNLGIVLKEQNRFIEAESCCRRALQLDPEYAEAHHNLGLILGDEGRLVEAEASLRRALELKPDFAVAQSNLLFTLNYQPDRSAEDIFRDYRRYDERFGHPLRSTWRPHTNDRNHRRRLRIGYVSPDFRRHSGRSFLEPLLANHDKSQVEIYAYAALIDEDDVTARYRRYADHWIPTNGMSDDAVAERIRDDRIDILVDLAGHTAGNLLGVFARKPAPVSVTWLGYGYTTGLSAIDYFLTDEVCAPEGCDALFAERPWRLPACMFVYRPRTDMGEVGPLPAKERGHITFGTLTRSIRINRRTVRVWAELLKAVPDSRLLVDSASYKYSAERELLASQFGEHGIPRERLQIGFHTPPWDVMRGIDIGLDCFPHNSGTTLFENLYMGVPYVTLAGRPTVGRLGGTILKGLGKAEWIANSETEYIAKAVELATDRERLAAIREELRSTMERSPLCDEPGFARRIESAYSDMFRRWCEQQA